LLTRESVADSDLLVIAGDNLFRESLAGFVDYARKTEATVGVHNVADSETIKKYGVVTIDADGVITHFEEKPKEPKSSLAAIALYFYSKDVLPLFTTYIAAGNNPDQPGLFLQWLYPRKPVNTFQITGQWLDIGSKETLEEANRIFAERSSSVSRNTGLETCAAQRPSSLCSNSVCLVSRDLEKQSEMSRLRST